MRAAVRVVVESLDGGQDATLGGQEVVEFSCTGTAPTDEALGRLEGVRAVRHLPDCTALTVTEAHLSIPVLLAELGRSGAQLGRLSTHRATLEDVFVNLTGRQLRD